MSSTRRHATRWTVIAVALTGALILASCSTHSTATPAASSGPTISAPSSLPPSTTTPVPAVSPAVPSGLLGTDVEVIPTAQKIVALTFDAGGNADGLSSIVSTLSERHVPATFFVTGAWASRYPSSVRQLVSAGFRLGNHTATHPHLTSLADSAVTAEIATGRTKLMAAGGSDPKPLFRFPFGERTAHTISLVNAAGYVTVRWTVDTLGWKGTSGGISTTTVVTRALGAARPGEIVLMHVGANPDDHTTLDAAALPTVISRFAGLGYRFVTLDALINGSTGGVILPGCDTSAWTNAPISVAHTPTVPPTPVVTGIRAGTHPECRYDRVVFDLNGAMPGYRIRYLASVTADPSGKPGTVPGGGAAYLLIVLHPAQGHNNAGASTLPNARPVSAIRVSRATRSRAISKATSRSRSGFRGQFRSGSASCPDGCTSTCRTDVPGQRPRSSGGAPTVTPERCSG